MCSQVLLGIRRSGASMGPAVRGQVALLLLFVLAVAGHAAAGHAEKVTFARSARSLLDVATTLSEVVTPVSVDTVAATEMPAAGLPDDIDSTGTVSAMNVPCANSPPNPPNGVFACGASSANLRVCPATCNAGYTGAVNSTCTNGVWGPVRGACVLASCPVAGQQPYPRLCSSTTTVCSIPASTTPTCVASLATIPDPNALPMTAAGFPAQRLFSGSTSVPSLVQQVLSAGSCTPFFTPNQLKDPLNNTATFRGLVDSLSKFDSFLTQYRLIPGLSLPTARQMYDQMVAACGQLPFVEGADNNRAFMVLPVPLSFRNRINAICAALRPCQDGGHEYLFGFAGDGFQLESTAAGITWNLTPTSFFYRHTGNGAVSSMNPLWVLTGTGVLGQMQTATQNVHLALNADVGASWAPGGRRDLVLVTATGNARLAVNLDTANNGFGGIDHAVMLSATASPSLNFLNGWVQIGTLGTVSADVYWRVVSTNDILVQLGVLGSVSLQTVLNSVTVRNGSINVGSVVGGLFSVNVNAQLGLQATVSIQPTGWDWGVRIFGRATVGAAAATSAPTTNSTALPQALTPIETVEPASVKPLPLMPLSATPGMTDLQLSDNFLAAVFGQFPTNTTRRGRRRNRKSPTGDVSAIEPASTGAGLATVTWTGLPDVSQAIDPASISPASAASAIRVPIGPVQLNGQLLTPQSVSVSSGVAVRMRTGDGSPLIGVMINGAESLFGVCARNTHSMCPSDAPVCWGFVCLPRKGAGGFCTHDVQCSSGRCSGFACAQCSADSQCPSDSFCNSGACQRKRADGDTCSGPSNCQSNTCTNGRCICTTCLACTSDAQCPTGRFCDSPTARCLVSRNVTEPCSRHRMCASGVCWARALGASVCRECGATAADSGTGIRTTDTAAADNTCRTRYGQGFCELNTANALYWTYVCRGCFRKDTNVDRAAACCSGQTYTWAFLLYCT